MNKSKAKQKIRYARAFWGRISALVENTSMPSYLATHLAAVAVDHQN